jgi:hypothetical protein
VWKTVDVVVVGSTLSAVSAALAAKAAARSVLVLADDPYFGSDLAGELRLWEEDREDPLVDALLTTSADVSPRPASIKRHLEQLLLREGIPFLFGVRPVGLLGDDGDGRFCGLVAAARTSLFCVRAGQCIDATAFGLVARLAQCPLFQWPSVTPVWRILAKNPPAEWPGVIQPMSHPYRQNLDDGPVAYPTFDLTLPSADLGADPRGWLHEFRSRLSDDAVRVTAAHLMNAGPDRLASDARSVSADSLEDADLRLSPGLWVANSLLPVEAMSVSILSGIGRRCGALAAEEPARQPAGRASFLGSRSTDDAAKFSFAPAFLRNGEGSIEVAGMGFPQWEAFDVVVAGGGTAGAPAAISAAREGATTLCLEVASALGGVGTTGMICSYWFGQKTGFTAEINAAVSEVDALSRSKHRNTWRPEAKAGVYHRMLREAGGAAWMHSFVFGVVMDGNHPCGALVSTPYGCGLVKGKAFIDATGNADLAAAAGARCRVIKAGHVAVQGTGLSPRVHPDVHYQNSDHTFVDECDVEGITAAHVQASA